MGELSTEQKIDKILKEIEETRKSVKNTSDNVLAFGQDIHDFRNTIASTVLKVDHLEVKVLKMQLIRLPLRAPWLALLLATASILFCLYLYLAFT